MRCPWSEVEEEWVSRVPDEPNGFLREHVGGVVSRVLSVGADRAVDIEGIIVVVTSECGVHLKGDPTVPAGRDVRAPVQIMVLADQSRSISGRVEPGSDGRAIVECREASIRSTVGIHASGKRILACQNARPAGA